MRQLAGFPNESSYRDEPWFSLWSSLCHQGDVYPASFAAVPHIVDALALAPAKASMSYFLLPASIEIARVASGQTVPDELGLSYDEAMARIPALVALAARPGWETSIGTAALAAIAAATGNYPVATFLLEAEESDLLEATERLRSR
ncbi:hypothetical protein J5837_03650 [Pseudoxanthomonas helianthi]|uniref:Uncharacterized protein n=1 Tax=Pseudoxanthomonas helianthi TaxID=1453541 RepID=A0A940WZK1_9GAMM|nr:hypothetical protein [Pseudoxanthomonas helianthi]MBP3983510.1 hypothetical protein [Pseudoxanthomonas helianthi]